MPPHDRHRRSIALFFLFLLLLPASTHSQRFVNNLPLSSGPVVLAGSGVGGGELKAIDASGNTLLSLFPFTTAFTGGVRVAAGDVNADGVVDLIAGPATSGGFVRVFSGSDSQLILEVAPFGLGFTGGVHVAAGDFTNDGHADVLVGAGSGGLATLIDGATSGVIAGAPFGPGYTGGVTVAIGDINADGVADLVFGTTIGGFVRVYNGATLTEWASGFPYGPLFSGGVNVATGDIDGDGREDVLTAPRSQGGPVFVFNAEAQLLANIQPFDNSVQGVNIGVVDINGDGRSDIVTGAGSGAPQVRTFSGANQSELQNFFAFDPAFTGGVFVNGGSGGGSTGGLQFTSPNSGTMRVSENNEVAITTTGGAGTTIASSGTLPSGVSFTNNGDGTAKLSGTPQNGTGGVYPLLLTATNGSLSATQSFTLTIEQRPAFQSNNEDDWQEGESGTFTVVTTGFPPPALSTGTLPSGLNLTDRGNGTGILSGSPAPGVYNFPIVANNRVGSPVVQNFKLTVVPLQAPPAFTSANHTTFTINTEQTFLIATSGIPTPSIAISGSLPTGITFTDNGDGTATLAGEAGAASIGTHPLTITATNGIGSPAFQNFTLTVAPLAPSVVTPNSTLFRVGTSGYFTIVTMADPAVSTIAIGGTLPAGVAFADLGDGTAALMGTPAPDTQGSYPLTLTATAGSANVVQNFTLTVGPLAAGALVFGSTNATFMREGRQSTFEVRTLGQPNASAITRSGALPTGVTFVDNGNGTATISGTPAAGSAGAYQLTLTGTNGAGSVQQQFTLLVKDVSSELVFLNARFFTAIVGQVASFEIFPSRPSPSGGVVGQHDSGSVPLISTDIVPPLVIYSGIPADGAGGTYQFAVRAVEFDTSNTVGTQAHVLSVFEAPEITSAAGTAFDEGSPGTFTVVANGFPTPAFSVSGPLPSGVNFVADDNGTATLSGTPASGSGGTYALQITASNGVGEVTQNFTLTVSSITTNAPTIDAIADPAPINEDASQQTINFTGVTAGAGETQPLQVTAISSNTALIPNPTVNYTSPNTTGSLNYTPVANQTGSATITVTVTDGGADSNLATPGDNQSTVETFLVVVNPVNDPPTAQNKNFTAHTNMAITLGGFLGGVTDADSGVNGCTPAFSLASVSVTTPAGGNVSILDATAGTVTFNPPAGYTGAVAFTYTVSDNGCPGTTTSAPATATVAVSGPLIWFVDPSVPGPGDGRMTTPFKFLTGNTGPNNDADDVDGANHRVFVFSGTVAGPITLNTGQWLVGQGATDTSFDSIMGIAPPAGTAARPAIGGARPQITHTTGTTLTLGPDNTVMGVHVMNSNGSGIFGDSVGALLVRDFDVTVTGGTALNLQGGGPVTGTGSNNNLASTFEGLRVQNTTIAAGGITLRRVDSGNNTAAPDVTHGITLINTGALGGVNVTGVPGTPNSGGLIQNTTEDGVFLANASNVVLQNMQITGADEDGIHAASVTNFTFRDSSITGFGNGIPFTPTETEDGMEFTGLSGTVIIQRSTIGPQAAYTPGFLGPGNVGVLIRNDGVAPLTTTVTGSVFTEIEGNAIDIEIQSQGIGNTSVLMVDGTTADGANIFNSINDLGISFASPGDNAANGTLNLTARSNTFTNVHSGARWSARGGTTLNAAFKDNTFTTPALVIGEGIRSLSDPADPAFGPMTVVNATVEGNSFGAKGIFVSARRGSVTNMLFGGGEVAGHTGNTAIGGTGSFSGDGSHFEAILGGDLNLDLLNNTFNASPTADTAVRMLASDPAGGSVVTTKISGNSFRLSAPPPPPIPVGFTSDLDFFKLENTNAIRIEGWNGVGGDAAARTFLQGTNTFPDDGHPDVTFSDPPDTVNAFAGDTLPAGGPVPGALLFDAASNVDAPFDATADNAPHVTQAAVDALVDAAINRWTSTGLSDEDVKRLREITFAVADLSGSHVAATTGSRITIDASAAGNRYFIDRTPDDDSEFGQSADVEAAGRLDLLTAIMHEMGHVLGLSDTFDPVRRHDVMYGYLARGERRVPR